MWQSHRNPHSRFLIVSAKNIPCHACPLRRTGGFRANTTEEIAFIQQFKRSERRVSTGDAIVRQGVTSNELYTLLSGWAFRHKSLPDGRRQILNFLLPGDFIGLQQQMAEAAPHGVEALTDARLCVFRSDDLWSLYREFPSLGYDITWLASHEELIVDDGLLSVGRRTAMEGVAMLLIHLYKRAVSVGQTIDDGVPFPIRQHHIADALGLSLVHTNRTLRRLRQLGLYRIDDNILRLPKPNALQRLAGYYDLALTPRPLI
ncbi:MAG: Crp/Fnr family transcriptional regulator [Burkholderiales bacterium]|nr:Crp/Fnr family transcriptional regulator [Burkholderiales bacterium]